MITGMLVFGLAFGQYRDIPEVVTKVATSAANWLKLETSARAIGMGGSHVASGRGVAGIPYNPASVSFVKDQEGWSLQLCSEDGSLGLCWFSPFLFR